MPLSACTDVAVQDIGTMYTLGDELGRCAAPAPWLMKPQPPVSSVAIPRIWGRTP